MFAQLRPYLSHIITWFVLLVLPFIGYLYQPDKISDFSIYFALTHFITLGYIALVFYVTKSWVAPKYFFAQNRYKYYLALLVGLGLYFLVNLACLELLPEPATRDIRDKGNFIFFRVIIAPIFIYSLATLSSTLIFLYDEQAQQKELNKLIELEKTAAELSMLKLQISPHFLFNTLNNIRWQIRKDPSASEESVLKLSEILRYIIQEVGDKKVSISQEIEHLKNYIELQTLRLPVPGVVTFNIEPHLGQVSIEPLLFIHFVENAFKYGIDSKNAPEIVFNLKKTGTGLAFSSKNKILAKTNALQSEGIGLTNVKRRLELLYPKKHQLKIEDTGQYFEVDLQLDIKA